MSHLILPHPRGSGSRIYIPPGTGWPSYTPGHWVMSNKDLHASFVISNARMFDFSSMESQRGIFGKTSKTFVHNHEIRWSYNPDCRNHDTYHRGKLKYRIIVKWE
jgi:hypothetical protein